MTDFPKDHPSYMTEKQQQDAIEKHIGAGQALSTSAGSGWIAADNPPEVTEGAESRRVLVSIKGYGHGPHHMIATWYNGYGDASESRWIIEDDCNHDSDQVTLWMDFPSFPNDSDRSPHSG